jgi:hypothetical protein
MVLSPEPANYLFSVLVTDANGCYDIDSVYLMVNDSYTVLETTPDTVVVCAVPYYYGGFIAPEFIVY